jgi:lysophospholipase L1-like esterase
MVRFENGNRVCFIGDSITAQNRYVALIADHYKTNFPQEDIKFFNCGISGGTASLLMKYFDEDVRPHKPTHIFIMLGVNDSNRDALFLSNTKERDMQLKKAYENFKTNFSKLCQMAVAEGAELTVLTPPPYAEYQPSEREVHKGGFKLILKYADYIKNHCEEKGYRVFDIHTFIAEQTKTNILYNDDRIHPNDLGHYYIAKCFLKNQGLEIGEFKDFPAYLEKWRQTVISYRKIYAVEYLIIKNDEISAEEKIALIKDYLKKEEYIKPYRTESLNQFFKEIAENYIANKPRQREMKLQIERLFDEATNLR